MAGRGCWDRTVFSGRIGRSWNFGGTIPNRVLEKQKGRPMRASDGPVKWTIEAGRGPATGQ
jgi:hypothetical protein